MSDRGGALLIGTLIIAKDMGVVRGDALQPVQLRPGVFGQVVHNLYLFTHEEKRCHTKQ